MEIIQKAYKFRLYPNKEQKVLIAKTIGSCRYVYNHFLNQWNEVYKATGTGLSYGKCSKELPALKQQKKWLQEVDSTALQTALKHLDDGYKRFFKGQNNQPRFKSKRNPVQSYTSKYTSENIRIQSNNVRLPKLGFVKIKLSRIPKGRIISATVKRTPANRHYISLLVEEPRPKALAKTGSHVGIDMGLKELMVLSNGDTFPNIKSYQSLENKLAKAQRSLSRKEYRSANYHEAKIKVARIHERIANIRLDYLHKVSTALVKNHDFIAIEDLDVEAMRKDRHLAKSVCDVSLSKLVELLAYKARWYDRKLVKVDRYFPSSQLCSACGCRNSKVKSLAVREWACPSCQTRHDRDLNASINILKEGERIHLQSTVGTTGVA